MSNDRVSFKFPLIRRDGTAIVSDGISGTLGISKKYSGQIHDDDPLIAALRTAASSQCLTAEQTSLVSSFTIAWLRGNSSKLGKVMACAVAIPQSAKFMSQVGFLDRTASMVASTSIKVAAAAIYLDFAWDLVTTDFANASLAETAAIGARAVAIEASLIGIPTTILKQIEKDFGKVGEPVKRLQFSAEPVLSLIRLCRFRSIANQLDVDQALHAATKRHLNQRILALFLASSRQIEGLCLSGKSEASAAVAAHAALALGICDLPDRDQIVELWETGLKSLPSEYRVEATRTLDAVKENLSKDFSSIDRKLNRQLASASATEAIDLVTFPIGASFEVFAMIAGTLERCSPEGHFKSMFSSIRAGFRTARAAAESTPDAIATAVDSGISVEAWARDRVRAMWPFGRNKQ